MSDYYSKPGAPVFVLGAVDGSGERTHTAATIVRNGRDSYGVYTEVRYDDGNTERVHRSMLKAREAKWLLHGRRCSV